jgi:hypothetical protein
MIATTTRRHLLLLLASAAALVAGVTPAVRAEQPAALGFPDLYKSSGVLGVELSDGLVALNGRPVAMRGYMAPPLKAEADFFVLTRTPVSLCPFCDSDASWPTDIVVVHLKGASSFTRPSDPIEVRGILDIGSRTDPKTGFVSLVRIVGAEYGRM